MTIISQMDCFGILNKVFPMGKDGLREVVPSCFQCPERKACLQAALASREGIEFRSDISERTIANGLIGRLQRWSRKKEFSRLLKQEKKKKR